jgi:hypothetical protein
VRTGGLRDLAQRLPADASPPRQQTVRQVEDAPGARPWLTAGDERPEGTTLLPAAHREVTAPAALAPVALPASIAPASHVPHGQLPGAAPLTSLPPVYAAPPLDTLMDALAREITREYHRFYGV